MIGLKGTVSNCDLNINLFERSVIWNFLNSSLLYAESISAWSNQGLVMCLLSILTQ